MRQQSTPLVSRPRPFGQIPVYRVDTEARELTPAELDRYRHLIPRETQRQMPYNPNNRNDGILLRVRGCIRNRSNPGNPVNVQPRDYSVNRPIEISRISNVSNVGASSVVNNGVGNANNNPLADRVFQNQAPSVLSSNPQLAPRPIPNALINPRSGTEGYLTDPAVAPIRPPRSYNGIPIIPDYNRSPNPVNLSTRNTISSGYAGAQESHPPVVPPPNVDVPYPNDQDPTDQQGTSGSPNITLRLNNRILNPAPSTAAGPSEPRSSPMEPVNMSTESRSSAFIPLQNPPAVNRPRNGLVDWLSPSFRRQQIRIDSMERSLVQPPRRLSLNHHNRHVPYFRPVDVGATMLGQPPNVRRTNSDSNLGRSLDNPRAGNETLVPEHSLPSPLHQHPPRHQLMSAENLSQRASAASAMLNQNGRFGRLFSSSNEVLADLTSVRRNLALRLLSSVIVPPAEQHQPGSGNDDEG